jgi:hypothetical protein
MRHRSTAALATTPVLLAAAFSLAACGDPAGIAPPPEAAPVITAPGADATGTFNPQPEPPRELFRFTIDNPELIDDPNLRPWSGTYVDAAGRETPLRVDPLLPAVRTGQTLHLSQNWTFGADGNALPAVRVAGVANLRNGRVVLNGTTADGRVVHVHGWVVRTGGVSVLGGELMFNPQPDPPAEAR